jgi:hypothetical protein
MRKLANGWSVWDMETKAPAHFEGRSQDGLSIKAADDAATLLNAVNRCNKHEPFPPPEEDLGDGDICSLERTPSTQDDKPLE